MHRVLIPPSCIIPVKKWSHTGKLDPEVQEWIDEYIPHANLENEEAVIGSGLDIQFYDALCITGITDEERLLIKLRWNF
jgi:hypothetical protein